MTSASTPAMPISEDDWVARLKAAAVSGESVDLAPGQVLDPRTAGDWSLDRQVPGNALRRVLADNEKGRRLTVRGALFCGPLDLDHVKYDLPLRLIECGFNAPLSLVGAKLLTVDLSGSRVPAIAMDNAEISGPMRATRKFTAEGGISARSATIKGHLDLSGARLGKPAVGNGRATGANGGGLVVLNLCAAEIRGGVVASVVRGEEGEEVIGFEADGEVRAYQAKINGQLNFHGAKLRNPGGDVLSLDGAEITGRMLAGDDFEADGRIRALGATINGQFVLRRATLRNPGSDVLNLEGAEITGAMLADGRFEANGGIHATAATIKGGLNLRDAILDNAHGEALNAENATISKLWLAPKKATGSIVLTRAVIDDLIIDGKNPPPVEATGWVIGNIHGSIRDDWRIARNWLSASLPVDDPLHPNQRTSVRRTSPQPWHALADVYDRNGDPAAALHLRSAAANVVTRQAPCPTKAVRYAYRMVVGNGYYPLMAILWLVVVVAAGCWIVSANRESIVPIPTRAEAAAEAVKAHVNSTKEPLEKWQPLTAETPCVVHKGYPCMSSISFAVNNIFPPAGALGMPDWAVAPDANVLVVVLALLKFAAWALTALLLAGVTGLIRKT